MPDHGASSWTRIAVGDPARENQIITLIGGVVGALAGGSAEAVNAGASIAANAHTYNYLAHEELVAAKEVAEQLQECLDSTNCAPGELQRLSAAYNEFVDLSAENTAALVVACSNGASAMCQSRIADLIAFTETADSESQAGFPVFGSAGGFAVKQSIFSYDAILAERYRGVLDGTITPALATQNALKDMAQRAGGVNAFLGVIGVAGGVAVCASGAGTAACVGGALAALNSANHLVGDVQQTLTGDPAHSALEQVLVAGGYSPEDAAQYQFYVDTGVIVIDVVITGGVAAYRLSVNASKLSAADSALAKLNNTVVPSTPAATAAGVNRSQLIAELLNKGTKITPENVIEIRQLANGKTVWLEAGTATGLKPAGLNHIIADHAADFANKGIAEAEIPDALFTALSDGAIVGYQGSGVGRPIYKYNFNGKTQYTAITVGSNGFIVGANPTSAP